MRHHLDREAAVFLAMAIAIGCMIGMFLWVHSDHRLLNRQQRALVRQARVLAADENQLGSDRLFLIESCQRLQIVRIEDNASHYADYRVFRAALGLNDRGIFGREVRAAIRQKAWVPLTDCRRAINRRGIRYRAPLPIPFVRRLPPRAALHVSGF